MGTLSLDRLVIRPLSRLGTQFRPLSRLGTQFRPLRRLGTRFIDILLDVWALDRERRALQLLDDRGLQDIGISRADIEGELAKPFWRR